MLIIILPLSLFIARCSRIQGNWKDDTIHLVYRTCGGLPKSLFYLFIYLFGVLHRFSHCTEVILRWVVGRADETSTYSLSGFCTVNCRATASNYQHSHLRPCREPIPSLRAHFSSICENLCWESRPGRNFKLS